MEMFNKFKTRCQRTPTSENYDFGVIPVKRGDRKQLAACLFIVIIIFIFAYTVTSMQPESLKRTMCFDLNQSTVNEEVFYYIKMYHCFFGLFISFCAAIIGKFIYCLCVFIEEFGHVSSRHDDSVTQTIKSCFQVFLSKPAVGGIGMILFAVFSMMTVFDRYHYSVYWPTLISSVGVAMITNIVFDFKILSEVELSEIHESSKTNVAQGLAWSYFTGYLKIILPDLEKTISLSPIWKEEEKLQCKLFAVVPLNCKIPAKLGNDDIKHKGITFDSKLPTLLVDRAGVKDRPYVNSVYEIQDDEGQKYYAICEYVTPIDTLHRMPLSDTIPKKKREEQCRLFVRILEELINEDDECKHKCKIVTLSGEDRPLLRDVLIDKITESTLLMEEGATLIPPQETNL